MKTTIKITGQINGNHTLKNAIGGEINQGMFNSFTCVFDSRKEAREAIRKAYQDIKRNYDGNISWNILRKSKDNGLLWFDSSKAEIINE